MSYDADIGTIPKVATDEWKDGELDRQARLMEQLDRWIAQGVTIEDVKEYFTETYDNVGYDKGGVDTFNTLADMMWYWRER